MIKYRDICSDKIWPTSAMRIMCAGHKFRATPAQKFRNTRDLCEVFCKDKKFRFKPECPSGLMLD